MKQTLASTALASCLLSFNSQSIDSELSIFLTFASTIDNKLVCSEYRIASTYSSGPTTSVGLSYEMIRSL